MMNALAHRHGCSGTERQGQRDTQHRQPARPGTSQPRLPAEGVHGGLYRSSNQGRQPPNDLEVRQSEAASP
jgi:hypothetical protein